MTERDGPISIVGAVSVEGAPLLLLDTSQAAEWRGAGGRGEDLSRATEAAAPYGMPGTALSIGLLHAVLWSIPTGTITAWRSGKDEVVLVRSWLDEADIDDWMNAEQRLAARELASDSSIGPVLSVPSGWLLILWAPEDLTGVDVPLEDGASLDLAIEGSSLVVRLQPGAYATYFDRVGDGANTATRCTLRRVVEARS